MVNRIKNFPVPYSRIILVLLVILTLTGCGAFATPEAPGQVLDATESLPTVILPTATARPPTATLAPVAPGAQVGRWSWTTFTSWTETYPPAQILMDIGEDGSISGTVSIYPDVLEIPQETRTLIQQRGCNLTFDALTVGAVTGRFISATEAEIEVNIQVCTVKYYGNLTLNQRLRGRFTLEYNDSLTQALLHPVDVVVTPLQRGKNVFATYCSACHGTYAEGAPGIPSLNTDQVRKYSDEQILEKINNGVINTVMPAWGAVLTPEEIQGVLELIRHIEVLETGL